MVGVDRLVEVAIEDQGLVEPDGTDRRAPEAVTGDRRGSHRRRRAVDGAPNLG